MARVLGAKARGYAFQYTTVSDSGIIVCVLRTSVFEIECLVLHATDSS